MSEAHEQALGESIFARFATEAQAYGLNLPAIAWTDGQFTRERDPASGQEALLGRWRLGERRVQLTLRPDGHVYGECDLLIDHPHKPGFWLDVLTIWGVPPVLKCEPTLIRKPA